MQLHQNIRKRLFISHIDNLDNQLRDFFAFLLQHKLEIIILSHVNRHYFVYFLEFGAFYHY